MRQKILTLLFIMPLLAACSTTWGGDNDRLINEWKVDRGYDVYTMFNAVVSVRQAHQDTVSEAKVFAEKKCGAGRSFSLSDEKYYPPQLVRRGLLLTSIPGRMSANIACGESNQNKIDFQTINNKQEAENKCSELGIPRSDDFYVKCVSEFMTAPR